MKLYAVKNEKGEWWDFGDLGFWNVGDCECAVTTGKGTADSVVKEHGGHVVELTEERKVKLPQDVGKELDDWMADNQDGWGGRIDDLLYDIVNDEPDLFHVIDFADDSEENYFKILDAYRYGWEAEKEPKYLVWVKLPNTVAQLYKVRLNGQPRWERRDKTDLFESLWYQFTKSEVEQLKSDYPYIEIKEVADDAND